VSVGTRGNIIPKQARNIHQKTCTADLITSRAYFRSQRIAALAFDSVDYAEFPYDKRAAVAQAVEELSFSATAAEVARKAGISIKDADRCLQALALKTGGGLKVRIHAVSS
jgi:hypothetical protein